MIKEKSRVQKQMAHLILGQNHLGKQAIDS